jgi:hypothetical protein
VKRCETTIDERLRAALTLDAPAAREGVDMSAEAITARIEELAEMSTLCFELAKARPAS